MELSTYSMTIRESEEYLLAMALSSTPGLETRSCRGLPERGEELVHRARQDAGTRRRLWRRRSMSRRRWWCRVRRDLCFFGFRSGCCTRAGTPGRIWCRSRPCREKAAAGQSRCGVPGTRKRCGAREWSIRRRRQCRWS